MDKNESVAVILVNFNGIKDSIECIKSINKSNIIDQVKIIFVDNASANREDLIIKQMFPDIITLRSDINNGFSAGNNIGIKYAVNNNYQYIMLLNNDTVIETDLIDILRKKCDENTVTVPKMFYYSQPDLIWYGGGRINKFTGNAEHINMNRIDNFYDEDRNVTFATGCCMMIASKTFKKIGLLEEKYFMYCEDTDFCIRLVQKDIKIVYLHDAKLWHKIGKSTGGEISPFNVYYITRNRLYYNKIYRKNFNPCAYIYSLISRYIRMWICKDKSLKCAYKKALTDYKKGVTGKVDF